MMSSKREAATVAATCVGGMPRIEIVGERRRARTAAFRARVVAESLAAGARVRDVAERHEVCPSLIYRWRRFAGVDATDGGSVRLFPVRIADRSDETSLPPSPSLRPAAMRPGGSIEIELAGDVRVRVDDNVSLVALRRVMAVLRG